MGVGEILQALMDKSGHNDTSLSKATGVPQPTIRRIRLGESKDPETASLRPLADFYGKTVAQLRGEIPIALNGVIDTEVPATRLPVISWVTAGLPFDVSDPYAPGVADSWEPFEGKFSGESYALRVKGDSMVGPDGSGFPEGTIIAVDPKREARNGDYVVVRFNNTDEATFKQLVLDGIWKFLKPLNPRYNTMQVPADAVLCGVVVEAVLKRKFK